MRKITTIIFPLLLSFSTISFAQKNSFHKHTAFNQLLEQHVNIDGLVNYSSLKKEKRVLDTYLLELEKNPPEEIWNESNRLAYWINLYNALTLQLVINHLPLNSITDIENAWDLKLIHIKDKGYTLNEIENKIIRVNFNEPRIHFAVNCAAKSCPKLLNESYTGEKLNAQLDSQTISFINDQRFNKIYEDKIELSKIFEWYTTDFEDLISFINNYSIIKTKENCAVTFKNYNWQLNIQ